LCDMEYSIEDITFKADFYGKPQFCVLIRPKEAIDGVTMFAVTIPAKDYSESEFRRVVSGEVLMEMQRIRERYLKEKLEREHTQELERRYKPIVQRLKRSIIKRS